MVSERWMSRIVRLKDAEGERKTWKRSQNGEDGRDGLVDLPQTKASKTKQPARKSQAFLPPSALGRSECSFPSSPVSTSVSVVLPASRPAGSMLMSSFFCADEDSSEELRERSLSAEVDEEVMLGDLG